MFARIRSKLGFQWVRASRTRCRQRSTSLRRPSSGSGGSRLMSLPVPPSSMMGGVIMSGEPWYVRGPGIVGGRPIIAAGSMADGGPMGTPPGGADGAPIPPPGAGGPMG